MPKDTDPNKQSLIHDVSGSSGVTYEQMFEWLEGKRTDDIYDNLIIDELQKEIGYEKDSEMIYDDLDTKEQDLYYR